MSAYFVHSSTVVDKGASIGPDSKIWHFSHIMKGAKIGSNCVLGQNVFVGPEVTIGNGVKIQNNVSVYEGVILDDEVFVGPSVVFTNVINPRAFIERKSEFQTTLVKKGATIGANATIICGNTIGTYALIGAGSVVTLDIPNFALCVGNPSRIVGWVSKSGHRLHFSENRAQCPKTGEWYLLENGIINPEL